MASVTTSQPKPELMSTERFWDHVNGGELDAHEVRKARQLEVDYLNKMRVFESAVRGRESQDAERTHQGAEGFANFSATPPLELVKLIISLVATAQRDPESWFGWREHGANDQIAMMHTFMLLARKRNTLNFHQKCGCRKTQNTED